MPSEFHRTVVSTHWAFFAVFILRTAISSSSVRQLHATIKFGDYFTFAPLLRLTCVAALFPLFWWLQAKAPKMILGDLGYVLWFSEYGLALLLMVFFAPDIGTVRTCAWWLQAAHLFFFSFFARSMHRFYDFALLLNLAMSLSFYLIPVFLFMGLSD